MEEVDYDWLFEPIEMPETKYVAVFDLETGKVLGVGPEVAYIEKENKIEIDAQLAEAIITNEISIYDCFIDFYDFKLEVKQVKTLYKIDDVLHRISLREFLEDQEVDADVFVIYKKDEKLFKIELTERFYGSRPVIDRANLKQQRMEWRGNVMMSFYITGYNDPNILYNKIDITVSDLLKDSYKKKIDLPENFSVFTRRLFKRYVLEII